MEKDENSTDKQNPTEHVDYFIESTYKEISNLHSRGALEELNRFFTKVVEETKPYSFRDGDKERLEELCQEVLDLVVQGKLLIDYTKSREAILKYVSS